MKTLLQTYHRQHGVKGDKTFEEINEAAFEAMMELGDSKKDKAQYKRTMRDLCEMQAYKDAMEAWSVEVQKIADSLPEVEGHWGSVEGTAIGYALDNVEAAMDTVKSAEEFVGTLEMYIDIGLDGADVNLPTFKFNHA